MDDLLEMYNVALAERLADAANPVKLPVQNLSGLAYRCRVSSGVPTSSVAD